MMKQQTIFNIQMQQFPFERTDYLDLIVWKAKKKKVKSNVKNK